MKYAGLRVLLVAEFGGKGNVASVVEAVGRNPWYFPSIGEYASVLESCGLEVTLAALFDRPTPVEGANGIREWLRMFYQPPLPESLVAEVEAKLCPVLFRQGAWHMDYRRLRIVARRPA